MPANADSASVHDDVDAAMHPEHVAAPDASAGVLSAVRGSLIFEMRRPTDANPPYSSDNYACEGCSNALADEYDAATLPDGFERSPWREIIAARARVLAPPDPEVEPIDVLESVPGPEFALVAQPQRAEAADGWLFVQLKSHRRFEWDAGDEVYEVTDGENTFIAFALLRGTDPSTLAELSFPSGYEYRVRTLQEPLVLDVGDHPLVAFSIDAQHLWQRTTPWN